MPRAVTRILLRSLPILMAAVPLSAFAASSPTLTSILGGFGAILNRLVPFLIGLALVIFLFALIKYVTAGGSDSKADARRLMIYGIVAIFVMVSVWGLVNFLRVALGIDGPAGSTFTNAPFLPSDFYSGPGQTSPTGGVNTSFGTGGSGSNVGSPFQGGDGFNGGGVGGSGSDPNATDNNL